MRSLVKTCFAPLLCALVVGCAPSKSLTSSAESTSPQTTSTAPVVSTSSEPATDWHLQDASGSYRGASVLRAYRTVLAKKAPKQRVVVAVMDSGVDVEQEDLQPVIWINEDEVAENGTDDDGNGYVDDVHGWNFVVDSTGATVSVDTYEVTREMARLHRKYRDADPASLPADARKEYAYYLEVRRSYETDKAAMLKAHEQAAATLRAYESADSLLRRYVAGDGLTPADVDNVQAAELENEKQLWLKMASFGVSLQEMKSQVDQIGTRARAAFDLTADTRAGAYAADSQHYGNHDLYGPDPFHGTHVAGIIGAVRGNGIGIEGIADHVAIMAIRTTPQGDERDLDVANGIRYAVDNGADIINMSFGKSHSGNKAIVDEAVRYAEKHGVLLVHASGNDGANLDSTSNFPMPTFLNGTRPSNWIEVGATTWKADEAFVAYFSNYGRESVDIFAPGRRIYSTQPEDEYAHFDGTSLAAPIVSGVAALLMAYYPELTAEQVRCIILQTATPYAGQKVLRPTMRDDEQLVDFGVLSATGGVVNAYEAVKRAERLSGQTVEPSDG